MNRNICHILSYKLITVLFIVFALQIGNSQIKWVDGYIIQNDGEKIQCLIKNLDWKNNPSSFKWKLSEEANTQIADIKSVKEFTIGNMYKYIRDTVLIDQSQNHLHNLSKRAAPEYQEKVVFLKTLIEGMANLYIYVSGQTKKFFYTTPEIHKSKALVYKKYQVPGSTIKENVEYKAQLWQDVNCSTISTQYVSDLDYSQDDLVNYFKKYNDCNNIEYVNYSQYITKVEYRLHLKGGVELTNTNLDHIISTDNLFNSKLAYRIESELEYVLPFHKNKWSLLIAPSYLFFHSEGSLTDFSNTERATSFQMHALELNLGGRHYFYFKNGQSIFVNSGISVSYPIYSELNIESFTSNNIFIAPSSTHMFLGVGFDLNNSLNLELKMNLFRYHILKNFYFGQIVMDYDYYAFQIAYRLF